MVNPVLADGGYIGGVRIDLCILQSLAEGVQAVAVKRAVAFFFWAQSLLLR